MTRTLRRARAVLLVLLASLVSLALALPAGPAEAQDTGDRPEPGPELALPAPTGPYRVGTTALHLVDEDRPDPWVPEAGPRQLMVSMFYPALLPFGRPARYVTPTESALILASQHLTDVPPALLSTTRTHARTDVPPVPRRRGFPLVLLSPGFSLPRTSLTSLAEDLASRGYVVAAVDHTYESVATTFPDGRVTTCVACERDPSLPAVIEGRAADLSFVLDELTARRPVWGGSGLIDPTRIGLAGHSIGGASAGRTMLSDPRVRAGINMDGRQFDPLPESGLAKPFLFLGAEDTHRPGADATWDRDWPLLTGWKRWLTLTGAGHFSFLDYAALGEQLGRADPTVPLPGERSVRITGAYVGAFFDRHLRGRVQPLLHGPSAAYPEVRFWP